MPKRSNDFQRLIAKIEETLASHGHQVTESKMVAPLTGGIPREIDVAIHTADGTRFAEPNSQEILVGIECRDQSSSSRRAGITWIDQIDGKYRDLPVARKVAVSRTGFTKGAVEQAQKYGIDLLTLEEARGTRWGDLTDDPNLPLLVFTAPVVADLMFLVPAGARRLEDPFNTALYRTEGSRIGTIVEICCNAISTAQINRTKVRLAARTSETLWIMLVDAENSYWLDDAGVQHKIFAIKFGMKIYAERFDVRSETYSYGDVDILRGSVSLFGKTAQVVLVCAQGGDTKVGVLGTG